MNTHKNQIDVSLNGTRIQYRNIHGIEPTTGYRIIPCQGIIRWWLLRFVAFLPGGRPQTRSVLAYRLTKIV